MIPKSIEEIDISDIQVLVDNEVPERRTLDYKQKLPEDNKDGTKAFLADICSFANTIGGDLIYGIKEERDGEGKTTGIPEEICGVDEINCDELFKKYEDRIKDGIEPRIQGIRFQKILDTNNKLILIIRVPQSWAAPHRVIYKMSHFYGRRNAGNYPLDINEIRAAFLASETLTNRIEKFRENRLDKICTGNTPVKLQSETSIVLQIVPLSSFTSSNFLNLEDIQSKNPPFPMEFYGGDTRYNFDGFLTFSGKPQESYSYAQLFRNGIIESVNNIMIREDQGEDIIYFSYYESKIISALNKYLNFCRNQGITTPIFIFLSLINVGNCKIVADNSSALFDRNYFIVENELNLPEVIVRDFSKKPEDILHPLFDTIWQAGGHKQSMNYDDQGNYIRR